MILPTTDSIWSAKFLVKAGWSHVSRLPPYRSRSGQICTRDALFATAIQTVTRLELVDRVNREDNRLIASTMSMDHGCADFN